MRFEVNRGQAGVNAEYVANARDYGVTLKAGHATLRLKQAASNSIREQPSREFSVDLAGTNAAPRSAPEDKLEGYSNYLFGSDPEKWVTRVSQYSRVRYADIYPGIDVVYYGNQGRLEHDFVVRPGSNRKQIELAFSAVTQTRVNRDGDLVLNLSEGEVRLQRPYAYQEIAGKKTDVAAEYVLRDGRIRFQLAPYDKKRTLVIDPVLVYSTFLGDAIPLSPSQFPPTITTDALGNLYTAGFCDSQTFPVTSGVVGETPALAFVSKINPAGTSLIYSTYLSGITPGRIAVDTSGNVYVTGLSGAGLPIPSGSNPFQSTVAPAFMVR